MKQGVLRFWATVLLLNVVCHGQGRGSLNVGSRLMQDADGLVESARNGNLRAVESILAARVDVNAKSKHGETPLVAAASLSNSGSELVEVFLARGARIDDRSLGFGAIWIDTEFSLHQQPRHVLYCGAAVMSIFGSYWKADSLGVTPLLAAAGSGKSQIVRLLLDRGANVAARTLDGATPLMLSSIVGDVESIKMLLLKGSDVNATTNKGQTALMLASWTGVWSRKPGDAAAQRTEAARLLVDAGAKVNAQDESGLTALMGAAEEDNLEVARLLLSKGADVNARKKTGQTALMQATRAGNIEMLRLLLSAGADPTAVDNTGKTAAFYANLEAVGQLLNTPANIEVKRKNNGIGMALRVLERLDRYDGTQFLKRSGVTLSDNEALILAACWGQTEKVRALLATGADANVRGTGGRPVLMYATGADNPDVVRMLFEKGAHVNDRDNTGETALIAASYKGSTSVARLLVESGADVNLRSDDGTTALIDAAWQGRVDIVRLLIDKGADVNARTKSGHTALERSGFFGTNGEKISRMLKEAGARE